MNFINRTGIAALTLLVLFLLTSIALAQGEWTTSGNNIYSTNSGNVGIGTTSPQYPLHIRGSSYLTKFSSNNMYGTRLLFANDANDALGNFIINVGGDPSQGGNQKNIMSIYSTAIDGVSLGTHAITFTSEGNVGIGTYGPGTKLSVSGGMIGISDGSNSLKLGGFGSDIDATRIAGTGSQIDFLTDTGSAQNIRTGGLYVSQSYSGSPPANGAYIQGKVGIGTTSPEYPLHIRGSSYLTKFSSNQRYGTRLIFANDANDATGNFIINVGGDPSQGGNQKNIMSIYSTAIDGVSLGTHAITFTSEGNVGIGTYSPGTKLSVSGGMIGISDGSNSLKLGGFGSDIDATRIAGTGSQIDFLTDTGSAQNIRTGGLYVSQSYSGSPPVNGAYIQGKVGIGTKDPSRQVEIEGNAFASYLGLTQKLIHIFRWTNRVVPFRPLGVML